MHRIIWLHIASVNRYENAVYKTEFSMYTLCMIERQIEIAAIRRLIRYSPVVGIIGARQVGKTTLARQVVAKEKRHSTLFDLEDPGDILRLAELFG